MDAYRDVMMKLEKHEILLGALLVVYSAMDISAPMWLNDFVVSEIGSIVVVLVALSFFLYLNPVIAVIGLVAAYELINRARRSTHIGGSMVNYLPKTQPDCSDLNAYNQFSTTLEQEMVAKMAPLVGPSVSQVTYKPVLDNDHDASPLH
jgi:hypothetical protein